MSFDELNNLSFDNISNINRTELDDRIIMNFNDDLDDEYYNNTEIINAALSLAARDPRCRQKLWEGLCNLITKDSL